jgi:hypothetical protein
VVSELFSGKRIFVFAGHYGSGKTEVAVNFAFDLARGGNRTAIVDFDIVNPYFRASDARAALEGKGVRVIASKFANSNVDVPALPAEINGLFEDSGQMAVFDVGGDDVGAKAVSRYSGDFAASGAVMLFVVNIRRPMTTTLGQAVRMFHEIQDSARFNFGAIVNNANMLSATNEADLDEGLDLALALSESLKLPIAFNVVMGGDPRGGAPGWDRAPGGVHVQAGGLSPAETDARGETNERGETDASGGSLAPDETHASALVRRSAALGIPVFRIFKNIHMNYD